MATTPNGTPAWTRSADHTFYGGHVDKANYQDEPIVNPKTDVGANAIQRMAADLAAVARMANFATVTFTANESGSSISVTACRLMTGAISAKVYSVAIGGTYSDPYSVDAVFAPAFAGSTCTSGVYTSKAYVSGTATVMIESGTGTGTHTVWIA
jgi:hypothetical protein